MGPKNKQFGDRMKRLRKNRSLQEVASAIGITAQAVHGYEGGRVPRAEILEKLSGYYAVSSRWLLTGDDVPLVAEAPEPYGDLERSDRKTLDEVAELLRAADSETKGDLKYEINKIQRLAKLPKKRA